MSNSNNTTNILLSLLIFSCIIGIIYKLALLQFKYKKSKTERFENDYEFKYFTDADYSTPYIPKTGENLNWNDGDIPSCYNNETGESDMLYRKQVKLNENELGDMEIEDSMPLQRPRCCNKDDYEMIYYDDDMNDETWGNDNEKGKFCGTKTRDRVRKQSLAECVGGDPNVLSSVQKQKTNGTCCSETWNIRYYKTKWASPVDGEPPCETTYYGRKERAACKESSGENGPTTDETNVQPKVNSTICCVPTDDWITDPSSSVTCYQSNGSQQYCGTGYHREIRTEGCGGPIVRYTNMSCDTGKVCNKPEPVKGCAATSTCEKHPTKPGGVYMGLQKYQYYTINSPTQILGESQKCEESCDDYDQDCVMSGWVNIEGETCTKNCGGGDINQERTVLTEKHGNGRACSSQLTRTDKCNNQPCKVYTISLKEGTSYVYNPRTNFQENKLYTFTHLENPEDPNSREIKKQYWFDEYNFNVKNLTLGGTITTKKCTLPKNTVDFQRCYTIENVDLTKPIAVNYQLVHRSISSKSKRWTFTFRNVTNYPRFFDIFPYGTKLEQFDCGFSVNSFRIWAKRVTNPESNLLTYMGRYKGEQFQRQIIADKRRGGSYTG